MNRLTRFLTALLALVLVTTPLAAQTKSATAVATVTALASLTLTKTADLAFGSQFAGAKYGSVGTTTGAATWTGSVTPGVALSVTFALPATLADPALHTVPFTCGVSSADVSGGGPNTIFNPNTGISRYPATGGLTTAGFTVSVGNNGGGVVGDPASPNGCAVDLTSAVPNTSPYSGTITTTVTVVP